MKLKLIFAALFGLTFLPSYAQQQAAPDQIETKKGPLLIQPVQHASLVLTWDGKTIYVDPTGGATAYAGIAEPDLILITDIHGDHMDPKTLDALKTDDAVLVAPQAVADQLPAKYKKQVVVLDNGKSATQLGIPISAIPMYNLPETTDAMHPKGRGNGYILDLGGKRIYIAGDTEGTPEMRNLKNIDVAFVPMNLPYTMDVEQAASAVLDFKPKVVYPYHYRGQSGLSDIATFKKLVNDKNKSIDVRLRAWYPEQ
ncbi:MBL fold metallo-hydrolase [Pontibacter sp. 172403-2]|uniref:MBL fold metallo-hydrolase n=1 Tax=Pontibacter rufus TaxID=2791028 RepID=UPI0018AF6765|nr:MBL fold metallo-hydrolase [Pontibacter sp. 172403-2]MBF9253758.1 MBL fold metallo-hydrolase [Pontibacter sp. 172403-2]